MRSARKNKATRYSSCLLAILETLLRALHEQLRTQNPDLLEVTAPSYERRIDSLQSEIAHYLS